jgi:acyl-CoA synthetase (AMP-forming)/AMP-acid ligase II
MGVKKGDHVAIWATNVPSWYITFWATTKIGAVLVTVNTAYKIHETEYLLRQSDTHTLVMIDSYKDSNYSISKTEGTLSITPASLYYANDAVAPEDQVKGQMFLTETGLLSGMISMLFGGLSLSHFGVGTSLLLCEALVLLGVFLIFFAARKQRTAEQI